MAGRITYGLIPGVAILLAVGAAFGQGMQTFKSEKAAQRHCPTEPSYGSTPQARTITLRATLRTVRTSRGTYVCKVEADKDGMHAWPPPPVLAAASICGHRRASLGS